ncbi:MAG TPA: DUF2807 domain-containing protein [Chitinophagaceae bacterium]|jgi:hypothetical protein|nr:DUF2807 domain-containing protein [Chitinophagaceae bacterium]
MKKLMMILLLAVAAASVQAQEGKRVQFSAGQLKHIELGSNLDVILVPSAAPLTEVKGDTEAFSGFSVTVSEGRLLVSNRSGEAKTLVILVNDLESISLGSGTRVSNTGILPGHSLRVFVNDGAQARIVTAGKVAAFPLDDLEVKVRSVTRLLSAM